MLAFRLFQLVIMREVTAAILIENGKVLIAQRQQDAILGSQWEFPGGKIEDDESPMDCLVRELREEFEMEAEVIDFFAMSDYSYNHGRFRVLAYTVRRQPGELVLHVHDDVHWVDPNDLADYDFLPADLPIVQKLSESDLF